MSITATPESRSTSTEPTDYERCQRLTERLAHATGEDWTFGYLGNLTARRDDRWWYAFRPHPGRVGRAHDNIGGVATSDLGRLAEMISGALQFARGQQ